MVKEREVWLDYLKGFAILLVVLGHTIQYANGQSFDFWHNPAFDIIYSFHMALFMMVSGYLFFDSSEKYSFLKLVKNKMIQILLPCIVWNILNYLFMYRNNFAYSFTTFFHFVFFSTWFLWAVFYCAITVAVIKNFLKDSIIVYLVVIVLFFFIPDFANTIYLKMMFPFFVTGYFVRKNSVLEKILTGTTKKKYLILGGVFLIYTLLMRFYITVTDIQAWSCYAVGDISILFHTLNRWLINLVGSLLILISFYMFSKYIKVRILSEWGKLSMGIYIISGLAFDYVVQILHINNGFSLPINIVYNVVLAVFITMCAFALTKIIMKIKYVRTILLGK